MTLKVVVQQPQLLPWIGLWNKFISADEYVIYAGVAFNTGDHQHRVQVNGGNWLTLPVNGNYQTRLCDVMLDKPRLKTLPKLARTIRQSFMTKKHPFRERLEPIVSTLETWDGLAYPSMVDLNNVLFAQMATSLGLPLRKIRIDKEDRTHLGRMEKIRNCLEHWFPGQQVRYLCGGQGREFMGYDSLGIETIFQRMKSDFRTGDSVLQLIAEREDPLEVIKKCAVWVGRDGKEREWDQV